MRLRTYRGGKPPYRSLHYRPLHGRSPAASLACNNYSSNYNLYYKTRAAALIIAAALLCELEKLCLQIIKRRADNIRPYIISR